ncbi:MAG: efflux RND transporter permease subunit [Bacteroidetes bacterium]|nr:MAG: efflux RND transporter permease subunit [Bacteroidota bacterium]
MSITEIAIKRPSLIIVIFGVLILGGIMSYNKLGYQLMPNFAQPIINIQTTYPGASPSEVESKVTRKIEDAVSALDNIDNTNSKSLENVSVVTVSFKNGTDIDKALQDAQRKIENIKADFPTDVKSPVLSKISQSDLPIIQLIATSNTIPKDFFRLMDEDVKPQLQKITGIANISLLGGEEREIRVNVNPEKLKLYGLSLLQINATLQAANIEVPTGKVKDNTEQISVRLAGKFKTTDDIKNQIIIGLGPNASPIRIGDVAEIRDDVKDASTIGRFNGKEGIALLIKKQPDANAVAISKEVKNKISQIEKLYSSKGLKIAIAEDNADFTLESVEAVQHDLFIAIILVAAVMLLFLHSIRNAVIVMIAIPTSLVSTLIVMAYLGYSFNLMTLLAMSLVVGILVDDSIVVLENITRHLEMGKDKRTAALDGRNEIGFSAAAITFVDVVVFLPIVLFVNTTIGEILRQFSVVIVTSTLMSLFVCFTLTPWLASRWGKLEHLNPKNPFQAFLIWFEKQLDKFTNWYTNRLKWALKNKGLAFGIVLLCFAGLGAMMSLGILGEELVSQGDQGKFTMKLEFDKRSSVENSNTQTKTIENYLLSNPAVKSVFANIGGPSITGGSGLGAANISELSVALVPKAERTIATEPFMLAIRDSILLQTTGVNIETNVVGIAGGGAPIELILTGPDYKTMLSSGQKLKKAIAQIPGADNVRVSVEDGMPELNVNLDREKMATLGVNVSLVAASLRTAFNGNDDNKFKDKGTDYDIKIMMDEFDRKNPDDVANMNFVNDKGQQVKLAQFASISQTSGPSQLERQDRQPSLSITAYNVGISTGSLSDKINAVIDQPNFLPSDVSVIWGGETKRTEESLGALFAALGIGLLCVYLLMVALYDNFIYPLVVLFSIPVALIGAMAALNFSMTPMSVFTQLGIIMLLGLVAKNAILIVDFTNQLKLEGKNSYDALIASCQQRLRPILMTTIAMVIGMLPIALAKGAGAEWKNGLGLVLVGGLTSSMMLTVFVVPMAYLTVDKLAERLGKLKLRFQKKSFTPQTIIQNN